MKLVVKPEVSRLLTRISQLLAGEGIRSYLVGGFVRDTWLGRDTADIDIAVSADALAIAAGVAAALGGRYVALDEENGVGRVVLFDDGNAPDGGRWELDFATIKGDIEHDLSRRDFTVNAMAIEMGKFVTESPAAHPDGEGAGVILSREMLIDPFNGGNDLREGVVRAVSETVFIADAARLIRAVRLAAELGFRIDGGTEALICRDNHLIASIAGERVREELLRILSLPGAGQHLAYLNKLGVLTAMIPELLPAVGVEQPRVHVWDVFDHSLQTVATVEFLLREKTWEYAGEKVLAPVPWSAGLGQHFDQGVSHGSTRRSLLKLGALLHDIAKPQTKTLAEDGRARFLGHPQEGAAAAAGILERLRFSTREIKLVELMVAHHLRPMQMSHEGLPSRRAIYRYFRDTGEAGIDILFLSLADHLAARGPYLDMVEWQGHARLVEYVLKEHFEEKSLSTPPKLVDGHDLIKIFGLSPGPRVGELLEALREAQAAGEVADRQQALGAIRDWLANPARTERNEST